MKSTNSEAPNQGTKLALPRRYRFCAEHSLLPTIATEGRSHIVRYANPAFCHLVARERAALLGRPFKESFPEDEHSDCLRLLDRVQHSHVAEVVGNQRHVTAEGEALDLTYMAWPVFDEKDEIVGSLLEVADTSDASRDRRRFEEAAEEVRQVNQQLLIAAIREQEGAEQAAETEHQLHHAQRMEGIGKLAGGIAHDFNNLLTAILGFTDMAADSLPVEAPAQRYLQSIMSAAERAALLTSQLLAFARKQVIVPRVVDVNSLLLDIDAMLQRLVGEDIELVCVPDADVGMVKVDAGQFGQVMVNLAVNARDAMPQGGKLTIETANLMLGEDAASKCGGVTPGEYVQVSVTDTGTGMSADVQEHIFEPFFSTKGPGKGTGLGLATCYGIIRQNNGHVHVESAPAMGTTVRIWLPRVDELAEPPREEHAASLPQGVGTILLVEDEAMVRDLEAQALRIQGYAVLEAKSGDEALDVIRRHSHAIDLVVTDLVMPVMGGRELADRLRITHPTLKVLFVSGYTDDDMARRGILQPGAAFLHKPFTPSDLAHKVRGVLVGAPS